MRWGSLNCFSTVLLQELPVDPIGGPLTKERTAKVAGFKEALGIDEYVPESHFRVCLGLQLPSLFFVA